MALDEYAKKRNFAATPEPAGAQPLTPTTGRFCVQRHNATRLHYDFRLEIDGTLKSWAVPKGPSLDPSLKLFAAMVEDHPVEYGEFEGNIPKGNYGAGSVMLWDRGMFELIGPESGAAQIARGDLKFRLHGEKLSGSWALVLMKGKGKGNDWLLLKKKDEAAQPGWNVEDHARSVKTGRTQQEVAADLPPATAPKNTASTSLAKLPGAVKSPLPDFFPPMSANLADATPKGDQWILEVKWDGVRGLAFVKDGALSLFTRNHNRCERQYPELQVMPHYLHASEAILDGEIVALDERGVSRFELIQPRIHSSDASAIARLAQRNPVLYLAFDLLYLDGYDLRQTPLKERRKLLARIVKPFPLLRISETFPNAGPDLLEAARQNGLEGLVAKLESSPYESRRSPNWLKIKLTSQQEFVIGGCTPGEREPFGSLAVGFFDEGKLRYAGNVGTGFTDKILRDLWTRLEPLVSEKRPFAKAEGIPKGTVWVKPELVAQVKFANWTGEKRLRAPVYLGLRNDKPPEEVIREAAVIRESAVIRETAAAPLPPAGFLPPGKKEVTLALDGQKLKFTNLDKPYFPEDGYSKRDVLNYYDRVASLILPHLKDRPLSLKRYPDGIHGEYFFQKNTPETYPAWLQTQTVGDHGKDIRYVVANDRASLLYLVNLGCIDHNPWMSRTGSLRNPDFILIDLDPQECGYAKIVEAALLVKSKLDKLGLAGYPKTTGGDGMHIYIPVEPCYTFDLARGFAEVIARLVAAERPDLFTTPRAVAAREKNKVYFDYLQIAGGKTISAPYVVRAYPGAPVATPLLWEELTPALQPCQFTLANASARFDQKGDLFAGVLARPQRLEQPFAKLQKLVR